MIESKEKQVSKGNLKGLIEETTKPKTPKTKSVKFAEPHIEKVDELIADKELMPS